MNKPMKEPIPSPGRMSASPSENPGKILKRLWVYIMK